jgi:hypothetical protein
MVIKVRISEETMARMLTGKRVEGTLGYDLMTCVKSFNMFHRASRSRLRDKLVKKLPWGWVKESQERYKVFESVPKELGMARVLSILDEEHCEAKDALLDREIEEFC